uniref:Uncharacterized protein n=1 Tax=Candidatus Kentrum sp. UNK TaxID=2126344 RepID=A0A451A2J3_9GAMM|nr:MAG: hypothetical protein BECKUNK1418G_GA0071005_101018 [Candidatus Kentron sp. UNK]VFK68402.1 MAG: hypothetical protein BECKUNK1418H_GA0071006_100218 [Candidatus Kentron sp. UNK]
MEFRFQLRRVRYRKNKNSEKSVPAQGTPVWILLLRANVFSRFIFTSSVIPAGIAGIQLPWMAINTSEASPRTFDAFLSGYAQLNPTYESRCFIFRGDETLNMIVKLVAGNRNP